MNLSKNLIVVIAATLLAVVLGIALIFIFGKKSEVLPSVVSVPEKTFFTMLVPPQSPIFNLDQPIMLTVSIPDPQNPDDVIVGLRSSKAIPQDLLKWIEFNVSGGAQYSELQQTDEGTYYLVISNSSRKLDVKNLKHSEIEVPVLKEAEALRLKFHLDRLLEEFGKLSENEASIAKMFRSYDVPCLLNPQLAQQKGENTVFSVHASLPSEMVFDEILPSLGVYGALDQVDFNLKQIKLFLTIQEDSELLNPVIGLPKQFQDLIDRSLDQMLAEIAQEEPEQHKFWESTVQNNFYLLGLNTKNLGQILGQIPSNEVGVYSKLKLSSFFTKLNKTLDRLSEKLPEDFSIGAQQLVGLLNLAIKPVVEKNPYVPDGLPFFFSFNFTSLSTTCEVGPRQN